MTATDTPDTTGRRQPAIPTAVAHRLDELASLLGTLLVGQKYLFCRQSYADEPTLHFGAARGNGVHHPKLAGKMRGTHVVSLRDSAWMLVSGSGLMVCDGITPCRPDGTPISGRKFDLTALESGAHLAPDAVVTAAAPVVGPHHNSFGIRLEFSDGSVFMTFPMLTDTSDEDAVADFEVLTPDTQLVVGPGLTLLQKPVRKSA